MTTCPVRYLPEWAPGMQFINQAKRWKRATLELAYGPFEVVRAAMVRLFPYSLTAVDPALLARRDGSALDHELSARRVRRENVS